MLAIDIKNLSYTYSKSKFSKVKAIDNINIQIYQGEIISIIGHTGSGKSTLAQLLNGLLKPDSGHILLYNKDIWKDYKNIRDVRFKVGLSFQYPENQLFADTVYDDIAFGPRNKNLPESEIKKYVNESIKFLGLNEQILTKSPFELSAGEKRKIAIAGIISMNPDILILDEPTADLDSFSQKNLFDFILKYNKVKKNVIILITHSMEDAALISDRIIVMDKGRIKAFDNSRNIFSNLKMLEFLDLDIPEVNKILSKLYSYGYNVRKDVMSLNEAENEIIKLIDIYDKGDVYN